MRDLSPWLGLCHIRKEADDTRSSQQTLVAAWADSVEEFEREVHFHTNTHGLQMILAEDVMSAAKWAQKHPNRKDAQRLAAKVSEKHPVEIGALGAGASGPGMGETPVENIPEYLTITKHAISNPPIQNNLPFWEQDWIALELKELLFTPSETEFCLRTYFIVDAALHVKIAGVFDLENVDVPVRCLFKGEAAETMKEAAPYLIDMTLPQRAWDDNDAVSPFHKKFFASHWGKNTGIFVRTTASMDEVWAHFRKFTKVQMEDDKRWVFFRFWDPRIANIYYPSIQKNQGKIAQWFGRQTAIHSILAESSDGRMATVITPVDKMSGLENTRLGPLTISSVELAPFKDIREAADTRKIVKLLRENFSAELRHMSEDLLLREVGGSIKNMQGYDIVSIENLYLTSAWAAFYGEGFENKDPQGILTQICQSNQLESVKMKQLKARLSELKFGNVEL